MTNKKDEPGGLLQGEKDAKPPQTEHRDDPTSRPIGGDDGGLTGSSSSSRTEEAGKAEGRNEPATKPAPEPVRLEAGPVDEPEGDEDEAAFRELIDEVLAAGATIVVSDGEQEIVQFERISVAGEGWIPHQGKKLYEPTVFLKPGDVRAPLTVAGFGLFDDDDVQVAWSPLPEPITVQPNTEVAIVRSIVF